MQKYIIILGTIFNSTVVAPKCSLLINNAKLTTTYELIKLVYCHAIQPILYYLICNFFLGYFDLYWKEISHNDTIIYVF